MLIEVIEYQEDSDGGATVTLDIDEEGKSLLIEKGFNSLLWDVLDKLKAENSLNELVKSAQEDGDYDLPDEVKEHNRKHKEHMEHYNQWRKDDMSNYPKSPEEKKIKDHLKK